MPVRYVSGPRSKCAPAQYVRMQRPMNHQLFSFSKEVTNSPYPCDCYAADCTARQPAWQESHE